MEGWGWGEVGAGGQRTGNERVSQSISQWKIKKNLSDRRRGDVSPRGLPCSQEEDAADCQVGEQHEEPHGGGEGVQEGKVARLAALVAERQRG